MKVSDKLLKWAIIVACAVFSVSAVMGAVNANKDTEDTEDTTSTETAAVLEIDG